MEPPNPTPPSTPDDLIDVDSTDPNLLDPHTLPDLPPNFFPSDFNRALAAAKLRAITSALALLSSPDTSEIEKRRLTQTILRTNFLPLPKPIGMSHEFCRSGAMDCDSPWGVSTDDRPDAEDESDDETQSNTNNETNHDEQDDDENAGDDDNNGPPPSPPSPPPPPAASGAGVPPAGGILNTPSPNPPPFPTSTPLRNLPMPRIRWQVASPEQTPPRQPCHWERRFVDPCIFAGGPGFQALNSR